MKKILAIIMVLAMVIAVMPTTLVKAFAYGDTAVFDANYDSESSGFGISIVRYKGSGGDVIIPDNRGLNAVVGISYGAFENCTALTSVTIPSYVTNIRSDAFKGCTNLRAAYFLGDAPTMGSGVFDNCAPGFKVYYISGKTGFTNPWCTYPTEPAGNVTITFDATGGTGGYSASMVKGAALSAPAVSKTGYIFTGWSPSVPSIVPSVNTTYTAQWVERNPTISFESSGGLAVAPITQGYNTSVSKPADPVKEGYTFGGWFLDSSLSAPVQWPYTITASTTFYAKWNTAGSYDIIFDAKGGTGGIRRSLTAGDPLTAPTVTKTGYTLAGWSPTLPPTVPAADTTYTALWAANSYMITYNGSGSTAGSTASSLHSYDISANLTPNGFTKIGYSFLGWSTDSGAAEAAYTNGQSVINITQEPNAIVTFYAVWTYNYTVTLDANGGTGGWSAAMKSGSPLTAPTVTRTGYTFAGWVPSLPATTPANNVTYTAQWSGNCGDYSYTVTSHTEATITKYNGTGGALTIPGSLDGYKVTKIGNNAFNGCTGLTSVTIPDKVTQIGSYAFCNCDYLNSVNFPNTISNIGDGAFVFCRYLTKLTIPGNTIVIGQEAFRGCGLTKVYFLGNAPVLGSFAFAYCASGFTVYHLPDKTGFTSPTWYGYPTAFITPVSTITFDANGGTGGTSTSMNYSATLTAPTVTKPGYVFAGWSPVVPATVPPVDTTYTAQYYPLPTVRVTKLADGFKVTLKDWDAAYKYQIWSYQKITSDLFSNGTASQWVLSKAYTSPASPDVIHETDGSISFIIGTFTSPDKNYTVSVRIMDGSGAYINEVSDSYTPEDVQEVKITKVLVDGEYSKGTIVKEIGTTPVSFMVIGNNVPGTVYTANVAETNTKLTAGNTYKFDWDTSQCTPGTYTIQFTASNGATSDTKTVSVRLYSLDTGIVYGSMSGLGLSAPENTALPKTVAINPSFTNGSFYYRISEPGRQPIFTSGLFPSTDTIEYTFTKYGIYDIQGFVNRQYEVKIGDNYDDGYFRTLTISRSLSEPSTEMLAANVNIDNPVTKGTPVVFTANASIGGIGSTSVQYSFWRHDAGGYALVKDWSDDNTLSWTPARVGNYIIEARAKGTDAGSYEVKTSKTVIVTDTAEEIAQGVVISLNSTEINANAQARVPITVKAAATSTNSEDLLYKFNVSDSAMGTATLQNYTANQEFIWTPRKAGTYTISVLVKNTASFGAYDAMQSFEVTVS